MKLLKKNANLRNRLYNPSILVMGCPFPSMLTKRTALCRRICPGDKIRIQARNVIPIDGTVISGEAEVNQSTITGESEAVLKKEGSVSVIIYDERGSCTQNYDQRGKVHGTVCKGRYHCF